MKTQKALFFCGNKLGFIAKWKKKHQNNDLLRADNANEPIK